MDKLVVAKGVQLQYLSLQWCYHYLKREEKEGKQEERLHVQYST